VGIADRDYMKNRNDPDPGSPLSLDPEVLDHLKRFMLLVIVGILANYAYYEFLSLYYLFVGGVQDWFIHFQSFLDYGISEGNRYNLFYLVLTGAYYFYLVKAGIALITAVMYSHRAFYNGIFILFFLIVMLFIDVSWNGKTPTASTEHNTATKN